MTEEQAIALHQRLEAIRIEIRAHANAVIFSVQLGPYEDVMRERKNADYIAREADNRDLREVAAAPQAEA